MIVSPFVPAGWRFSDIFIAGGCQSNSGDPATMSEIR
jgi:hypothetical protein